MWEAKVLFSKPQKGKTFRVEEIRHGSMRLFKSTGGPDLRNIHELQMNEGFLNM